jgi:queuine tRNA-ribosyltransferase
LFQAKEMLGPILVSIHNLQFFADFTAAIRQAIEEGDLAASAQRWTEEMYQSEEY